MPARVRTVTKIEGLAELDAALAALPKAVARNTLKRVLVKNGQRVADTAKAFAPKEEGELAESIQVSARVKNTVGNAEFHAAMKAGLGQGAAISAMRDARRAAKGEGSFAEVHVGPAQAKNKADAVKRIVQEFGSHNQPGTPYMRPAWDQEQNAVLEGIKQDLGGEIMKSAARVAKNAARRAAKLKAGK